ncbi:hypothetical protein ACFGVS_30235 [Mucilaginibacter sp. AW1-7]
MPENGDHTPNLFTQCRKPSFICPIFESLITKVTDEFDVIADLQERDSQ